MIEKLQNLAKISSVVVLNDFFLDRIVKIKNPAELFNQVLEKSIHGGSIRGIQQTDLKGGNGTNVAFALARLGCPVSLVTIVDKSSAHVLQQMFSEFDKTSLFIIDGRPGRTTSLEFDNDGNPVNIIISDLGDNQNFGPERLGRKEQDALQKADAVMVTNWASNERGTELSQFVFNESASALHFLDPADIQTRAAEFKEALSKLKNHLNSLCLNENECNILLKQFELDTISEIEKTKKLVHELATRTSIPIDLHTSIGSFWSNGLEAEFVKSFPTKVKFVTGAGDVWDAANIIGYLVKLTPTERLKFANAAASLYVANSEGIPPKMDQVLSLVRSH